jgi:hypothetical protein
VGATSRQWLGFAILGVAAVGVSVTVAGHLVRAFLVASCGC